MICARELRIKVVAASFSSVFSISVGDRGDVFAVGPGMNRAGGLTNAREATPEIQHLADQVRGDLETKTKKTFKQYVAETYATQVVAGINYFIKVRVDNVRPRWTLLSTSKRRDQRR
ncbi:hypothetical protein EMCRGX_G034470 [Ephydatia muelleri]